MIDERTRVLNGEMLRFGRDLEHAAGRRARRSSRGLLVAFAVLLVAVPAALGGARILFVGEGERAHLTPPRGYVVPSAVGTGVAVASGQLPAGRWIAYATACGGRAGVVVVTPDGSRNGAACGAIPPGGRRKAAPSFAPSTLYDGLTQTTFIYAAVPSSIARVELDLRGRGRDGAITLPGAGPSHHELTPTDVPAARKRLGMDVRFVVLAVPGEQSVKRAQAFDGTGHVVTRCGATGGCEDTAARNSARP